MTIIRFADVETERLALGKLAGRFSFKTWATGEKMVPEPALSYLKGPENGPPMVWLHGVSGRAERWREHLEAFADRWQVYALDARGHGLSGRTPGHYLWLDHARGYLVRDLVEDDPNIARADAAPRGSQ